jgi:hypothetical protein
MSSNLAYALPTRRPVEDFPPAESPRPIRALSPRTRRRTRPKLVYAVVAIGVIFGIFLAQLFLTIALSGGAYRITALQGEQRDLGRMASSLGEKLDTVGSTQNLAANAKSLGMVASASQAFLRLSDGKVLGTAKRTQPSSSHTTHTAATGDVPNSLLTGVPLVTGTSTGHGDSNTAKSTSSDTQSKAGGAPDGASSSAGISPAGDSSESGTSGDLPSPQTH